MSRLLNVNDPKFGVCIRTIIDKLKQENDSNENIYSDDSLSDTEPDNVEIDYVAYLQLIAKMMRFQVLTCTIVSMMTEAKISWQSENDLDSYPHPPPLPLCLFLYVTMYLCASINYACVFSG